MTSTERIVEYIDLTHEEHSTISEQLSVTPAHWPRGNITFEHVSFRYSDSSPWILNDINIKIISGEKV